MHTEPVMEEEHAASPSTAPLGGKSVTLELECTVKANALILWLQSIIYIRSFVSQLALTHVRLILSSWIQVGTK